MSNDAKKEENRVAWYGRTRLIGGSIVAAALILPAAYLVVVGLIAFSYLLGVVHEGLLSFPVRYDYIAITLIYALLGFGMFFRNRYQYMVTPIAIGVLVVSYVMSLGALKLFLSLPGP